jgi:L-2-amino-thiazoline-4-carboxylic acid hydrolase
MSAYDFLYLTKEGPALIVESLMKHFKKEGELIAYDFIHEARFKGAKANPISTEQLISSLVSITTSEKPNLMTCALKVDVISSTDKSVILHIKECAWAKYFRDNHPEVGYLMSCSTDEVAYKTANEHIRMQRSGTLMEGAAYCDFRVYTVEK